MIDDKTYRWILDNLNATPADLRLRYANRNDGIDYAEAITQIECRRKFGKKLSETLTLFPRFYFPSVLSGEQSSSDLTAQWHASMIAEGATVVDLTSGLGIDVFHIARRAAHVTAVEHNAATSAAIAWNARGLSLDGKVDVVCDECENFIEGFIRDGRKFDVAFIDPARRGVQGQRVFALSDCTPDVIALYQSISRIADRLIIKASPMLDITHTIESLPQKPYKVAVAGTTTECRELVAEVDCRNEAQSTTVIEAVTLGASSRDTFTFTRQTEEEAPMPPCDKIIAVGDVVCEPYPAVMKVAPFRTLAQRYRLYGMHANTHLFFTSHRLDYFPGRQWRVEEVLPYSSAVIKRFKNRYNAISITARNFGMSAEALRGRLGVREGNGDMRLFAITDAHNRRLMVVCRLL